MTYGAQTTPNLRASGTIRPYRFVKQDGSTDNAGAEADANEVAVGVSNGTNLDYTSANHAVDGDVIHLQPGSIVDVEFGGTVTVGGRVKSDADGKAVAVATSGATQQNSLGVALHGGADGKISKIKFFIDQYVPEVT
jgi:hypothetical protein